MFFPLGTNSSLLRLFPYQWLLLAMLVTTQTQAEDQALLIGVSQYQQAIIPSLPGVKKDLQMMKQTVGLMGFADHQIEILSDAQATLANVLNKLQILKAKVVSPSDRVLIYFSGHGSSIPDENQDESDQADEVLVLHDSRVTSLDPKSSMENVLLDDFIQRFVASLSSKNIMLIFDACHSGTASKSLNLRGGRLGQTQTRVKSFIYAGMPSYRTTEINPAIAVSKEVGYIALSAAGDQEKTIDTAHGGLFTLAISKAVKDAALHGSTLTPKQLLQKSKQYIDEEQRLKRFKQYTPRLSGNEKLFNKGIAIISVHSQGKNWKTMESLIDDLELMDIQSNQMTFAIGDELTLRLVIERPGYLNIVAVSKQDDEPTVLFPNKYHSNNRVEAGNFAFPTVAMQRQNIHIRTGEPYGQNFVVAFVSSEPLNFYKQSLDMNVFVSLTQASTNQLEEFASKASFKLVEEKRVGWIKAGSLFMQVCRDVENCQ